MIKATNQRLYFRIAAAIAIVLAVIAGVAAPAFAASTSVTSPAPTRTPAPRPAAVIPLRPVAELTSLNATVELDVNGLIDGERAQGDLNLVLMTNDQEESKITASGGLLGELAAQAGGSLMGLFTPSSIDLYNVPQGNYVVANGFFPVCVKLTDPKTTATLEELSPQSLLSMLTSSDVARGKLVGRETLNGVAVNHYLLDGDAFLAAARQSRDPQLKAFGQALRSAEDADLYVDAKSGYPVAFRGSFGGAYKALAFEGDLHVEIELTGASTNPPVKLPRSCNRPILP